MKLQKATQFALLAVLDLARDPDAQHSVAASADRYGISANHRAKVLRDLGRAGLVTSLYDVIHLFGDTMEGEADIPAPAGATDIGAALGRVLTEVDEIAVATLKSISLATLIKSMNWMPSTTSR